MLMLVRGSAALFFTHATGVNVYPHRQSYALPQMEVESRPLLENEEERKVYIESTFRSTA